jgi:lysophospholipase L1-like esterase
MNKCLLIAVIFLYTLTSIAQTQPPFWDDVQTIKKYDKIYKAPEKPILFVGSSSIRKWDNLLLDFQGYKVLNRGIGGAVVNDITFHLNDLVFSYKPSQIVLYVGENDLPNSSADTILARTRELFKQIRLNLPETPIVYLSIKPSPVRSQFVAKAAETNRLIKEFLLSDKNAKFVDVYSPMLDKSGKTRPELFLEDMLHMNEKGYRIWKAAVKPHLEKLPE